MFAKCRFMKGLDITEKNIYTMIFFDCTALLFVKKKCVIHKFKQKVKWEIYYKQ